MGRIQNGHKWFSKDFTESRRSVEASGANSNPIGRFRGLFLGWWDRGRDKPERTSWVLGRFRRVFILAHNSAALFWLCRGCNAAQ